MRYRLSDFFKDPQLHRDGSFIELGHADSSILDTLAYCDSVYYLNLANDNPNISCIITTVELAAEIGDGKGSVGVAYPRASFYQLHEALAPIRYSESGVTWVHPSANLSPHTRLGVGVSIGENVVLKGDVTLGDGCFVDAGAIIGAEGLLYYTLDGANHRIRHRGGVVIGNHATILANAVVAQGIHPGCPTSIGDYVIIGIASTIGHEAILGRNVVISGNCVIARGAQVQEGAWIGTGATIREYARIGHGASVKAGSVVVDDVPSGAEVSGNFAIPHKRRMLHYLRDRK